MIKIMTVALATTVLGISLASAQEGEVATAAVKSSQISVNQLLFFVAAALVFLMQAGFCLVELGFARAKNCLNVVIKNTSDVCVAATLYTLVGFGLMFGETQYGWFSLQIPWVSNWPTDSSIWLFLLFQTMFVGAAATIVSGAIAERTKFIGYLVFSAVLSGVIYPVIGHWAWASLGKGHVAGFGNNGEEDLGWLEAMGFHDFAGSSVVHAVGGAAALAGIIVIGARKGRFDKDGNPVLVAGHNMPLVALGTLLLWTGWFGFNVGSLGYTSAEIGRIGFNTLVAGATGGLGGMFCHWLVHGRPDPNAMLNGVLCGLVSITACCDVVTPFSAILIGLVSGVLGVLATGLLLKCKLDDVVGAIPVHLMGGIWGTLAVGLFHENGFSADKVMVQAIGTFSIAGAAFLLSFLTFHGIRITFGIRASEEEELMGLDFSEHAANAYPEFSSTSDSEF